MFSAQTYVQRRRRLCESVASGIILLLGNDESGANYRDNTYPFRQDSSFLYFFGIDRPGLCAVIDVETGKETIFGNELTIDDIVWTGPMTSIATQAERSGVASVQSLSDLSGVLDPARAKGQTVHYLPPYRPENIIKLRTWLSLESETAVMRGHSASLVRSVIALRSKKSDEEVSQIEAALETTHAMHLAVIQAQKEGRRESDLAAAAHAVAIAKNRALAYPIILTIQGQILHNHGHPHALEPGRLVLGDFGAESAMHYASDITRTIPVSGKMTSQQSEIYSIVLMAQRSCIERLAPGIPYKDIHLHASVVMTQGLIDLGMMKGDASEAVAAGAHALFFPHGLGHMLGLDVHDMEDLGEDLVGYGETQKRSDQFGLRSLRLARKLEEGFVLTVEPGLYFIPELIDRWRSENKHAAWIDYGRLEAYRTFGGIRIEDDCLVTAKGSRVLGPEIPKSLQAISS